MVSHVEVTGVMIGSCIVAAVITWLLQLFSIQFWQFDFGFMNIAVNALLTVVLLWCIQEKKYVG